MLLWVSVMVGIVVVVGVIWFFTRKPSAFGHAGSAFPPGTRAFESEMSLPILAQMIEAREVALRSEVDESKRAELTTQIANMRKQATLHRAVVEAGDVSPGKMSFGVDPDSDRID